MDEIHTEFPIDFDSFDDPDHYEEPPIFSFESPEELPPPRRLTEAEVKSQTQLRIELFQHGSTFRKTKRNEIVGIDNVLGEIDEIIHWLCHAKEYAAHKSRLQPGVIFSGYPGCLAADTSIELNRGGKSFKMSVEQVVQRMNGDSRSFDGSFLNASYGWDPTIPTQVRSRFEDGTIRLHDLESAVESGVKSTYTLTTTTGRAIRATEDHPFWTPDGWAKLSELASGDQLYVDGGQTRKGRDKRVYVEGIASGHPLARTRNRVPQHRLVIEAHMNEITLPEYLDRLHKGETEGLEFLGAEMVVHHRDGDTRNNTIENLEVLASQSAHALEHSAKNWRNVMAVTTSEVIDSIVPFGEEPTYDLSLSGEPRNFLANGFVVHNTGKTLVSRWIASESQALFVNVRDFVHNAALFTDADIRDLFTLARAAHRDLDRPILLFWDEFENSAAERSGEKTTPEQRSVVSQLTAELDGIHGKNAGILLIGCTNYQSSIDQALMRRGRMGVQIEFHAPDRQGKEKILAYYLGQMTCEKGIDVNTLSYFFPKHNTAADIEEACVEAWRHAVCRSIDGNKPPCINDADLVQVFIKQLVGPPTTFTLSEEERMPVAIHECGHAITALVYGVPLRLITVQPGKKSLGRVMTDDIQEYVGTIPETINHMRTAVGGIAAEKAAGLERLTGSTNDIKGLNSTAEWLIDNLGVGAKTGLFNVTSLGRTSGYSNLVPQASAEVIRNSDIDILALIQSVEADVCQLMIDIGKENLFKIAKTVNDRVTMTGKEFKQLFIDVYGSDPTNLV